MRRRKQRSNGLEAATDVIALPLGVLGVAVVIALAHVRDNQLPPVHLPQAEAGQLGDSASTEVAVTLRLQPDTDMEIFVDDEPLAGGLDQLESALQAAGAQSVALRADSGIPWEDCVTVMDTALNLGMQVSASVAR